VTSEELVLGSSMVCLSKGKMKEEKNENAKYIRFVSSLLDG